MTYYRATEAAFFNGVHLSPGDGIEVEFAKGEGPPPYLVRANPPSPAADSNLSAEEIEDLRAQLAEAKAAKKAAKKDSGDKA